MKRIPYEGTTIAPEKTQAEIQTMLYTFGAQGVQWTTIGQKVRLAFILAEKGQTFTVRIDPPLLLRQRRETGRRGAVVSMTDQAASMRLLKWWLKVQLEAIEYGLISAKEAFLSGVTGRLPSGEEVTVGEIIIPKLNALEMTDLEKALPSPKKASS